MSQKIRVIKCFQCSIFQVDVVKKSTKWECKVCHVKQTVRKEYFRGSGAECREKVMELNLKKGRADSETERSFAGLLYELNESHKSTEDECNDKKDVSIEKHSLLSTQKNLPSKKPNQKDIRYSSKQKTDFCVAAKKSKWNDYI